MKAANISEGATFCLSLSFHVLLFVIYFLMLMRHPVLLPEKKPALYVPSYLSSHSTSNSAVAKTAQSRKYALHEKADREIAHKQQNDIALNSSQAAVYQHQQPVLMVGEKLAEDPLKKMLGMAISRHLYYPQAAQELNMQGVVGVGFTIFPDGSITNIQVVRSSEKQILDVAAIEAVQKMNPVANVDIYLKQPRFLVVNVIFR